MMISAVLVCNFYTQIIKEVTWINLFQAKGQTQASGESEVKVKSLSRVRLFAAPMDCSLPGYSVHGIF